MCDYGQNTRNDGTVAVLAPLVVLAVLTALAVAVARCVCVCVTETQVGFIVRHLN